MCIILQKLRGVCKIWESLGEVGSPPYLYLVCPWWPRNPVRQYLPRARGSAAESPLKFVLTWIFI